MFKLYLFQVGLLTTYWSPAVYVTVVVLGTFNLIISYFFLVKASFLQVGEIQNFRSKLKELFWITYMWMTMKSITTKKPRWLRQKNDHLNPYIFRTTFYYVIQIICFTKIHILSLFLFWNSRLTHIFIIRSFYILLVY